MVRRSVDNLTLERWRTLPAAAALETLAIYVKQDPTFKPIKAELTTRWHVRTNQAEFEILCTGPKFWDGQAKVGGCGAIDLAMHLHGIDFKRAVKLLKEFGL